ncbi:unnamed protein product [Cylicocyclus nassatus]|uniref:Uncharacterized protein n=1 Tax=Cylicocyclus nassatus TaxID=53992 RepID=A0AA36GNY6_CYLNA|nr:unnamed protein product [Cylicocyclus nassatus]
MSSMLRRILLIFCLVLMVTSYPLTMDGMKMSEKILNPPYASTFMNCKDVDFGSVKTEDIPKIKKLYGCTYKP